MSGFHLFLFLTSPSGCTTGVTSPEGRGVHAVLTAWFFIFPLRAAVAASLVPSVRCTAFVFEKIKRPCLTLQAFGVFAGRAVMHRSNVVATEVAPQPDFFFLRRTSAARQINCKVNRNPVEQIPATA